MQIQPATASSGARWLNQSIHVIERNVRPILLAALTLSVLSTLPALFGPLAPLLLLVLVFVYPVMMGGLVHIARCNAEGRPASPGDLFAGFRSGRTAALMAMALPQLLFAFVMVLIVASAIGMDNLQAMSEGAEPTLEMFSGQLGTILVVGLLGGLAVFCSTLFGIPLAMLDGVPGLRAIGLSLKASARNFGAVLVYILCIIVAVLIAALVLLLLSALLGLVLGLLGEGAQQVGQLLLQLLFNAGVMAVLAAGHFLAWTDVFARGRAAEDGTPPAEPPREVSAEL